MIRNNSSITEFEAMTTTQSSRAGSPLPGGFYCYEDGLTSPTRYSPVLVGGGSYSSSTSGHSTSSLPPSPSRVVASCKNCGFSFRVRSPRTTEFCNKGASHLSPSSWRLSDSFSPLNRLWDVLHSLQQVCVIALHCGRAEDSTGDPKVDLWVSESDRKVRGGGRAKEEACCEDFAGDADGGGVRGGQGSHAIREAKK